MASPLCHRPRFSNQHTIKWIIDENIQPLSTISAHNISQCEVWWCVQHGYLHHEITHVKLIQQLDWNNWQMLEYLQWINTMTRGCLLPRNKLTLMLLSSIPCGHMWLKLLMDVKRLGLHVMAHPVLEKHVYWIRHMQTALIRPVLACFMDLGPPKNLSSMVQMCWMLLQKRPHQARIYTYPDWAFQEWWVNHKKKPPLEDGYFIPILSAM